MVEPNKVHPELGPTAAAEERTTPSATVVEAVARAKGVAAADLDQPLNAVVDPDALDALFAPRGDGTPRDAGAVSFAFAGTTVTVTGEAEVAVEPEE